STNLPPNSTCNEYKGVRFGEVIADTFSYLWVGAHPNSLQQAVRIATIPDSLRPTHRSWERSAYGCMHINVPIGNFFPLSNTPCLKLRGSKRFLPEFFQST
ncbi:MULTISPECIES: hypothetical protein, partial [unclassified Ruegeria]|uniref:hypothetical protein n=1 Tax=unclassified Ruegeria TaxID=2625375 RepID=UPI001C123C75